MRERIDSWIGSASMSARRPIAFARTPAQHADDACLAQPARDFDVPFLQLLRDESGGAVFFVAQFRMRVDVATNRLNLVVGLRNRGDDFHAAFPRKWFDMVHCQWPQFEGES